MIEAILCACLVLCAQEKPTPVDVLGPQGGSEVERLVERVKEQLAAVDQALQAASEASTAEQDLAAAREAHLSVIRDIEELIKQVKYAESQSSRGGTSQPDDGRSGGQPQPRNRTRESDGATNSEPQPGSRPPRAEPGGEPQGEGQPQGGEESQAAPEQRAGTQPPPPPETGRFERQDTDARWGLLPPKIQERLMNLHVDDMPERYRSWMDAYVRKLNELDQGGRRP